MIDVVLVDDHRVVVEGLKLLLQAFPDVTVVGAATDGAQGADLAISLAPDVVLMDLSMPGVDGVQATRRIVEEAPDVAVVVLQAAAAGGSPIDPRVARALVETRRRPTSGPASVLTAKQREVLDLVAAGQPNRLVAKHLGVTEKTVKAHLTQIYAAIGVTDRVQATLWARDHLSQP